MLVVFELDVAPFNALIDIFFLFKSEHMLVELLLKLFVGIVDTELLERILLKYLKSKDVEESNE